ncbi:MAG TPA: ATP-dependent Clp protease ATP-binding subunit [Thermoanaerobaculales bacterium]|nr:ATP-dependent Clp protease ATP-binding subunit [Thermoanaerobaculales bacterium]HQL29182.1 ATP-dependent Clp protease ATP-binding subunit [Thermoanaerobaculales bacterium]HQP43127.1 ATP-dependent Clp protease ATP-binding subunit [Thermoanaerobaculales bacterium]
MRRSLFFARYEASRSSSRAIGTEHLLLGMLREADPVLTGLLERPGGNLKELRQELLGDRLALDRVSTSPDLPLAEDTKKSLAFAVHEAESMGHSSVGTEHLLLGLLRVEACTAARYLSAHGFDLFQLREEVVQRGRDAEAASSPQSTPNISEYARDLTALAAGGGFDPLIGRDGEVERVIQILCRRTKNNPLLLGDAGVGKTAIVEGLATRIVEGNVPSLLANRRILALDLSLLVAGTKYRGQFEERLKGLLKELQERREIIIFIDEIHSLIGTGSAEGSLDAANILKPALSRGEITCIGSTTVREYRKYVEKDRALSRRFQAISVLQPTEEQTIAILQGIQSRYEEFHGVRYSDGAIRTAVSHAGRYITDRSFPDKAIDVIDEAGARVKLRGVSSTSTLRHVQADIRRVVGEMKDAISRKDFEAAVELREEELRLRDELAMLEATHAAEPTGAVVVERSDIEEVVSSWTGVPVTALEEDEADRLLRMEEILRQRVVGQDDAIKALARAIRRSRLGVTSPFRPIGSFVFLGPSGVGKTEVARQLAQYLFQDHRRLVRFDMSEYMEKHTVSRLIGSPPGYVGFEEGGQLSEQVRRQPYSVILLDEIEKAHPDIYNLLLQVLEDGRLTDSYGNLVDFTNTLIIMTSNLGSRDLADSDRVGFTSERQSLDSARVREVVDRQLRRHFPPEFINRLDDVIVFDPLAEASLLRVAEILLEETADNLTRQRVTITYDQDVPSWLLAQCGVDPQAGARPLRRLVKRWVEDAVADYLILNRKGDEVVLRVRLRDGQPVVEAVDAVRLGEDRR